MLPSTFPAYFQSGGVEALCSRDARARLYKLSFVGLRIVPCSFIGPAKILVGTGRSRARTRMYRATLFRERKSFAVDILLRIRSSTNAAKAPRDCGIGFPSIAVHFALHKIGALPKVGQGLHNGIHFWHPCLRRIGDEFE